MIESDEITAVRERYARRAADDARYSMLNPAQLLAVQERQRAMAKMFALHALDPSTLTVMEVGCGGGANLQELLRMGCSPQRLAGIELLAERHAAAREGLPRAVDLQLGDAATLLERSDRQYDLVMQFTVFSSLLDDAFQQRLAQAMWRAVKPGGAALWYDFTVDNPRNPDVRGVPLKRIKTLFPNASIVARRLTLAPPISRAVMAVAPWLHGLVNSVPLLRTHVLAWVKKEPL